MAGRVQRLGVAERPDHGEHLADDVVGRHLAAAGVAEVHAGVGGVGAVVALHPEVARLRP